MIWIFVGYLLILLLIGIVTERLTKGVEGFLLGDRAIGPWLTALSYEATAYSGWLMLGFPGRAFTRGFAAIWVGVSCVLGDALNWILVSRRLREETARLRALTIPEYLERRFARANGYAIQLIASLAISFFMLVYLWSQFVASGKTLQAMLGDTFLGKSYTYSVLLSAAVIILYTFQGGYRAVIWTDSFQAVMMLIALVILPLACFIKLGGWPGLMEALNRASAEAAAAGNELGARSSHLGDWFAGLTGLLLFRFLFEDAGVGAGYLGQPHICTRFMSIREPRQLRPAFVLSILFAAIVCAGAVFVGLVGHGWFRLNGLGETPGALPILEDHEKVLPYLAQAVLPPWLAGLVLSAIMAAIMSTASGFLITVTSSMTQDVYHRVLRPGAGQTELVIISRLVTLALGAGAIVLALYTDPTLKEEQSTVYQLVLYGWGGLAACFAAPVTLALLWPKMTRAGCLAGMIAGAVTVLAWRQTPMLVGNAYEVIPAMAISAVTIVAVSCFTQSAAEEEIVK